MTPKRHRRWIGPGGLPRSPARPSTLRSSGAGARSTTASWRFDLTRGRRAAEGVLTDRGLHGAVAPLFLITPVALFAACVAALHCEDWLAGSDFEHPHVTVTFGALALLLLWTALRVCRGRRLRIRDGRAVLERISPLGSRVIAQQPVESLTLTICTVNVMTAGWVVLLAGDPAMGRPQAALCLMVEGDSWLFVLKGRRLDINSEQGGLLREELLASVPEVLAGKPVEDAPPVLIGF